MNATSKFPAKKTVEIVCKLPTVETATKFCGSCMLSNDVRAYGIDSCCCKGFCGRETGNFCTYRRGGGGGGGAYKSPFSVHRSTAKTCFGEGGEYRIQVEETEFRVCSVQTVCFGKRPRGKKNSFARGLFFQMGKCSCSVLSAAATINLSVV